MRERLIRCLSLAPLLRLWFAHPVKDVTNSNFGLLIANLVPGFAALIGVSYFSDTVRIWLGSSPLNAPTLGGFLYVTVASVASGLTVSSVRFLLVDTIHHCTGIRPPQWDFSRLQRNVAAYKLLVESTTSTICSTRICSSHSRSCMRQGVCRWDSSQPRLDGRTLDFC